MWTLTNKIKLHTLSKNKTLTEINENIWVKLKKNIYIYITSYPLQEPSGNIQVLKDATRLSRKKYFSRHLVNILFWKIKLSTSKKLFWDTENSELLSTMKFSSLSKFWKLLDS